MRYPMTVVSGLLTHRKIRVHLKEHEYTLASLCAGQHNTAEGTQILDMLVKLPEKRELLFDLFIADYEL